MKTAFWTGFLGFMLGALVGIIAMTHVGIKEARTHAENSESVWSYYENDANGDWKILDFNLTYSDCVDRMIADSFMPERGCERIKVENKG